MLRAHRSEFREAKALLWPMTWIVIAVNCLLNGDFHALWMVQPRAEVVQTYIHDMLMLSILLVVFTIWFLLRWRGHVSAHSGAGFAIAGAALAMRALACVALVTDWDRPTTRLADHSNAGCFIETYLTAGTVCFGAGLTLVATACVVELLGPRRRLSP